MRVRYSFSSRKTGKLAKDNKHRQEFPNLAKRVISQSDIVLEILDAIFWEKTRNLEIVNEIKRQRKKLIFIFNKSDLVDKKKIEKDVQDKGIYPYVFVSCVTRKSSGDLRDRIKLETKKINKETVYVGVVGYPNTGKSSIINLLVGKNVARVASESGFTKGIQKLKLSDNIFLLDTPGVVPSSENSRLNDRDLLKHAQINVRTWDKAREPEMIVEGLMKQYQKSFEEYYSLKEGENSEDLIETIGRKKGFLLKGDKVDTDRTARQILRDFQEGRIKI